MEYKRDDKNQYCDTVIYMIIDGHTGKPQRYFPYGAGSGTLEEALNAINGTRDFIVKLECIKGFEL